MVFNEFSAGKGDAVRRIMIHVLKKTAWSFLLALAALEGMLLVSALYELMVTGRRWGITFWTLLRAMPFLLLERASFAIPLAAAVAGAYVFSGMAASNELVAVESMGRDTRRLLWPLLALGIVLAAASLATDELGRGYGTQRIQALALSDAEKMLESRFQSGESVNLGSGATKYWLTMRRGDGGKLPWASVLHYSGETLRTAAAGEIKAFKWFHDADAYGVVLELLNVVAEEPGRASLQMAEGAFVFRLPQANEVYIGNKAALRSIRGNFAATRELTRQAIDAHTEAFGVMVSTGLWRARIGRAEVGLGSAYQAAVSEADALEKARRQAQGCFHTALATVLAPPALLVLGAALGAGARFRSQASAFIWTIIVVVLVYYPVIMMTRGLVESGIEYAAVLPYVLDAAVLAVGTFYWRRAAGAA